jgi:hypothetical protein
MKDALVASVSKCSIAVPTIDPIRPPHVPAFIAPVDLWCFVLYGPMGDAVLCCGVAMWRSGLFPRALAVLGAVAGAVFVVGAFAFDAPRFAGIQGALNAAVLLFWMLGSGVLLWRRTPTRPDVSGQVPPPLA